VRRHRYHHVANASPGRVANAGAAAIQARTRTPVHAPAQLSSTVASAPLATIAGTRGRTGSTDRIRGVVHRAESLVMVITSF